MDFPLATVSQLSDHLKALRKARGMTQADLGRLIGVKQSRIADIERDPGAISVAQMHQLLSALGGQLYLRDGGGGWQSVEHTIPGANLKAQSASMTGTAHVIKKKPSGSW